MNSRQALTLDSTFAQDLENRRPIAFRHNLAEHDALTLEAVAQLSDRLGEASVTSEAAVKPLVTGETVVEPSRTPRPADLIRDLDDNGAWMTLLNIEQDPAYRDFVDEVINATAAQCSFGPKSWRRRAGFIFASSPGAVTPAHFDIEQSLIMQLRGNRTLSFGRFANEATKNHEISRYWNGSYGRLATMPELQMDLPLGPGDGAYIPPYVPHWLQNSDATSLSLTLTFFTRSNENESLLQVFNERASKVGLTPKPVGTSIVRDRAKIAAMRTYSGARRRLRTSSPKPR